MKTAKKPMKTGWKVFDKNLQCKGFQFEIGKTYSQKGEIIMCKNGFHFHENRADLFNYYSFDSEKRVCEIEASGKTITDNDKSVCRKIKLIRELSWTEVLSLVNIGKDNSGYRNSGYSNSGDRNSGYRNSGDRNSGYRNSGYWNSCNFETGIFNSKSDKIRMFNKKSDWDLNDWHNSEAHSLSCRFELNIWIYEREMTEQEKINNKDFHVRDGYLKTFTYQEACQSWWNKLNDREKQVFFDLPNFNAKVFEEITGIKI